MLDVEKSPLLECAIETMQEVFIAFPPQNTILTWNRRLEEVTGFASAEIETFHPADLLADRDTGWMRKRLETVLQNGHVRFEACLHRKHSAHLPYEFTGSLFHRNGQRLICLVGRSTSRTEDHVATVERESSERSDPMATDQDLKNGRPIRKENRLLRLTKEAATSCNEAENLGDALHGVIEVVCRHGGWQVGHAYLSTKGLTEAAPSEGDAAKEPPLRLLPPVIWNCEGDGRFDAFRDATETQRVGWGQGLPGQVVGEGTSVWIEDVRQEESFLRRQAATVDGLKGAMGVPVPMGNEVTAVLEFFSEEAKPYDEELVEVMESVGVQIGRVAEREEHRRRLTSSLEQLQSLKGSAAHGIVLADEEGRITDWNRGAEDIFGYEENEIIGRPLEHVLPESQTEHLLTDVERADRSGDGYHVLEAVDVVGRRKSGERFPVDLSLSRWETDGKPSFGAILRDGTERRRREDELRQKERRYRRLFEEAEEGIAMLTPNGYVRDVNPAAAATLKFERETLRTMNVADLFVEPGEWKAVTEELYENGALLDREIYLERADGETIVCRMSMTLLRNPDGDVEEVQTFFQDVTERRQTKETPKESEEMFRHLSENALVGIGLIQDGTYVYVNPALSDITGYSKQELLGESPTLFVYSDDWPRVQSHIKSRLDGEIEDAHYETRIRTKSGETRYVRVSGTRIDYRGEPAAIATIQDVTEQRRLQREMIQVQEEERKRLGQELHDSLSSQLTGANMKLSFLSEKVTDDLSGKEISVKDVVNGMKEVQTLIKKSAGDVRRLSHGLNPAGLPEGDLLSALKGLVSSVENARLECVAPEWDDEHRSVREPTLGEEAATHLYRIAQEAVNNARKYAEASEIAIRLRDEDDLVIEVEDDGIGFDRSELREEGLGLRSMRRRADLLDAELTIESNPGDGTRVRCRLPR